MEAAVLGSWLSNLLNMARYGSKRAYGPRALSHRVWRAWASPCAASSRPTSSESIEAAWWHGASISTAEESISCRAR